MLQQTLVTTAHCLVSFTFQSSISIHLSFLSFFSLSTKDIEGRMEALGLFETLKSDPESFYTHMTKYVYPSIAGIDQLRILFYFTLLENCSCANYFPQSAMKPDTHIKLLKKLKAVAAGE